MFVGHYAASLALKHVEPRASLGSLFIAVQLVDIVFFPLVLLGVEQLNVIENFTASTHFELVFMPYTHSLAATFVWAGLSYLVCAYLMRMKPKVALVLALAVASHWFLDLLVHTPDLPLWSDASPKLGFGLWQDAVLTYALEAGLLGAGLWLYLRATHTDTRWGKVSIWLVIATMLLANLVNVFGPLHDDSKAGIATSALIAYAVFALLAYLADKPRRPKPK